MRRVLSAVVLLAGLPAIAFGAGSGGWDDPGSGREPKPPTEGSVQTDGALPDGLIFGEEITVLGDAPFIHPIEMGRPVSIRFGIGEIDIEATDRSEVRADLDVRCRPKLSDSLCAKYRRRLRLEPIETDEGFEVRLVGLSKWKLRKLELDGRVEVPRWSPLAVRIGIGDVEIRSGAKDLSVTMGIGDLTIRAPESQVASVGVRTKIGDASVTVADDHMEGRRKALLGAKLYWFEGEGTARIEVGLKIGDAKVVLE